MEIRGNTILNDPQLAYRSGGQRTAGSAPASSGAAPLSTDLISVSRNLVVSATAQATGAGQTRLIKDSIETLDKGYRRTQTFERGDGRNFTRIEEFTVSERNARRTVIQQNASGNTTRLDEVLERQDDGTFRRTQRFTDEAGETTTAIQTGFVSADPFILSGGQVSSPRYGGFMPPAHSSRGTQVDLQA